MHAEHVSVLHSQHVAASSHASTVGKATPHSEHAGESSPHWQGAGAQGGQ